MHWQTPALLEANGTSTCFGSPGHAPYHDDFRYDAGLSTITIKCLTRTLPEVESAGGPPLADPSVSFIGYRQRA